MSSSAVVKQLLLLYVLLLVQHLNRLLEEPRPAVKCMCILYLRNVYVVEYPLFSDLLPLFLVHRLEGINHALVQTGDLDLILEFPIDKLQGVHSRDDLVNWVFDLKQNLNELGERRAKTKVVGRVPLLTQVHIRDSFN